MNNSTSDYFIALSNKLSEVGKVVVIAGKVRHTNIALNNSIVVLEWPSQRANQWKDFIFLCKAIKRYKPHLMISIFGFVNLFMIAGKVFGVKHRVAWIRSLSTQFSHKPHQVLRRILVYKMATQIITNSMATKIDASKFYKINMSKIEVLPNSVKDYSQSLKSIKVETNNILYVGRLHKTKGLDVLLHAIHKLILQGFHIRLDIIGNGPMFPELMNLVKAKNMSKQVRFLGVKNKREVLEAYKRSYITVVPSYIEAFGFTVIEAMSVGACVIGADNSGIKEIISHNETGLLFKTGDYLDLADSLTKILLDASFRNNLANNGFQRFLNVYETKVAIKRDFEFFKSL